MAKFDLNDSGVVVIVGSGAGGGTLGNELAQKGVKVVILEAGARIETAGLRQRRMGELYPARLVRHAHHLGKLARRQGLPQPAGLDRQGGRRFDHALGRRLAALRRARVQGSRAPTATSPAPICWTGRSRSPRWSRGTPRPKTRWASPAPTAFRGCPATTISRCWKPARRSSATRTCTPATWRSTASHATGAAPASRSASASRAASPARNGRRSTPRSPRARRPAISRCAPTAWRSRSSTTRPAR